MALVMPIERRRVPVHAVGDPDCRLWPACGCDQACPITASDAEPSWPLRRVQRAILVIVGTAIIVLLSLAFRSLP